MCIKAVLHIIMDCCCERPKKKTVILPLMDIKCSSMDCSTLIRSDKTHEWRAATTRNRIFRFCSDDCWSSWLSQVTPHPSTLMSYSPSTPLKNPHNSINDMPMLNI